jgi:hypothetical protein
MKLFDVNVAGTASVMRHLVPFVTRSQEKKVGSAFRTYIHTHTRQPLYQTHSHL